MTNQNKAEKTDKMRVFTAATSRHKTSPGIMQITFNPSNAIETLQIDLEREETHGRLGYYVSFNAEETEILINCLKEL